MGLLKNNSKKATGYKKVENRSPQCYKSLSINVGIGKYRLCFELGFEAYKRNCIYTAKNLQTQPVSEMEHTDFHSSLHDYLKIQNAPRKV